MKYTIKSFLAAVRPYIIEDMKKTGILASLTAAQAVLESGYGNSLLSQPPNNNLFGIKGSYNGKSVIMESPEWDGTKFVKQKSAFKVFPSWAESIYEHSAMFNRLARYKNLRGCTDWKLATKYVKQDGYATDPGYTGKLQQLIIEHNLMVWDNEVLSGNELDQPDTQPKTGNPYPEPTKVVKFGSKGNCVRWLQYELNRRGYGLIVDGSAGALTILALKSFQEKAFPDNPEEWDGICGPKTREKLRSSQ